MTHIVTPADNANQFTASWINPETGKEESETYYVEDELCVDRYLMFERFRLETGMGIGFPDLVKALQSNLNFIERAFKGEEVMTQMTALNYNLLQGINDIGNKKYPFAIWLCTLFFNTKNENRRTFQEEVMREKVRTWELGGINSSFFLKNALLLVQSFSKISAEIMQMSSALDEMTNSELDQLGHEPTNPQ